MRNDIANRILELLNLKDIEIARLVDQLHPYQEAVRATLVDAGEAEILSMIGPALWHGRYLYIDGSHYKVTNIDRSRDQLTLERVRK